MTSATIEEIPNEDEPKPRQESHKAHMPASFVVSSRTLPAGATIIANPFKAYLKENGEGNDNSEPVQVAVKSYALRSILPVVDGQDKVEAILNPGYQIVAMSEEVCNALALSYDPAICLPMISANSGINKALGLAWNVPFRIGDITLYLQVHILHNPTYDILLGRPFDVLTRSVVRNYSDENQTVTIVDPNTG